MLVCNPNFSWTFYAENSFFLVVLQSAGTYLSGKQRAEKRAGAKMNRNNMWKYLSVGQCFTLAGCSK